MIVRNTKIEAVKIIEPKVFGDDRGFFMETWNEKVFKELVADRAFVQDNHSKSAKGILRGLHFQTENCQGKLVRVIQGEVFDVAVDLRGGSSTYGQWVGEYLSADNKKQLWIPEGFAHGFLVVSNEAEFVYKCTDYYNPQFEHSLAWDDPDIGIEWPLSTGALPQLSDKDMKGLAFSNLPKIHLHNNK
ncbi:dTDP-4-dehydrorhamnose 3,5-epimerase [Vibrio cholerae]|uniref:dTDP-4-dehydrorhamnose 3,5-epimerase n=1 Tax=Vibrio cincinnatiensis TaxID=675 RepID=UPI001ED06D95|nr:dTDP-4-dehydrorhamnose 3,5-epimerase [Vibrio cincinnatiensis]EGR0524527.1 dTDP-4-dehydrorhamnose 3,5-epimerase [Vibrio cholerae]EGR0600395.1 dTDP-4-dehydrorhamnose 3,5-epimerase [Vibrio cholerae]